MLWFAVTGQGRKAYKWAAPGHKPTEKVEERRQELEGDRRGSRALGHLTESPGAQNHKFDKIHLHEAPARPKVAPNGAVRSAVTFGAAPGLAGATWRSVVADLLFQASLCEDSVRCPRPG